MEATRDSTARPAGVYNVPLLCFSLAYGYVLQALPFMAFRDRENYLDYAEGSLVVLADLIARGPLPTLANEPLWLLTNIALAQLLEPQAVVRTVIFLGATAFAYVLLRADPKNALWLMLFLLMPQILKNFITHVRQGFAIAMFYLAYFSRPSIARWAVMAATPFVHASFFFVLPIVALPSILERIRTDLDIRLLAFTSFAAAASVSLGIVASLAGARQVENYEFEMTSVSGLGLVFWAAILAVFVTQGRRFLEDHQRAIGVLIFYLVSYLLVEVTARIFESGMPLVLLAGLSLTAWRRWAFISGFLSYSALQWALRLLSGSPF